MTRTTFRRPLPAMTLQALRERLGDAPAWVARLAALDALGPDQAGEIDDGRAGRIAHLEEHLLAGDGYPRSFDRSLSQPPAGAPPAPSPTPDGD